MVAYWPTLAPTSKTQSISRCESRRFRCSCSGRLCSFRQSTIRIDVSFLATFEITWLIKSSWRNTVLGTRKAFRGKARDGNGAPPLRNLIKESANLFPDRLPFVEPEVGDWRMRRAHAGAERPQIFRGNIAVIKLDPVLADFVLQLGQGAQPRRHHRPVAGEGKQSGAAVEDIAV